MTAHGLRLLPANVSGCFVFVFAVFVFVFLLKNSWNVYVCCPAIPGSAVNYTLGTQSVACFFFVFFCFEVISFCLVFEDETKGSTQKGEKGDQVTVSLIAMPREKSLFAFHVWTPSNGSEKKKISVACVAGARTAWLFVPGRTIKLHLRLCVQICLCCLCKRWRAQYCALHLRSVISHNSKGGQFTALQAGGKGH